MKQNRFRYLLVIAIVLISIFVFYLPSDQVVYAQAPTGSIPTVTSSPAGPTITVRLDPDQPQINVRSGPGTEYDKVGVLLAGQSVPAKGRTPGGSWILIVYPGTAGGTAWVFSPFVDLSPGASLPIIEPPPTPTPLTTATIDPTLAAQFIVTAAPTRLPTYTPAPPLEIPTFVDNSKPATLGGVPMGLIIIILVSLGVVTGLLAFTQNR
ncbi:MAG: SH3 domain-containing protein [Anaerolineae bacterium]|jgi:hypothetical protein|nr:SH3 domain-containing protein [Anaerolineae bacterium]